MVHCTANPPRSVVDGEGAVSSTAFNRILDKAVLFEASRFDGFKSLHHILAMASRSDNNGPLTQITEVCAQVKAYDRENNQNVGDLVDQESARKLASAFMQLNINPVSSVHFPKEQREAIQDALGILREAFGEEMAATFRDMAKAATTQEPDAAIDTRAFEQDGRNVAA